MNVDMIIEGLTKEREHRIKKILCLINKHDLEHVGILEFDGDTKKHCNIFKCINCNEIVQGSVETEE